MSKTTALARNTALIAISRIATQLVTFFMLPLYTTMLSVSEYGVVDLVITYAMLLAPLIMLNVQQAIFRFLIDARSDKEMQVKIITNAIEITIGATLIAMLLYLVTCLFTGVSLGVVVVFYFVSFIMGDFVLQVARGLGYVKAFAVAGIAQGVLTVILNVFFLLVLGMRTEGVLLGMALGTLVPSIILAIIVGVHRTIRFTARDYATKKEILTYSIPMIPNTISWWVYSASDRTIVTLVLGVAANGIYAVTNRFANISNSFSSIFYASWSESAVLAINDPDRDEFYSKIANMMLRGFGALGILIMCITPVIFPLLVHDSFNEALLYLPVLILGTVLNTVVSFYSAIYVAKKLTRQVANTSIVAAIINLTVCLGLIWFIGIWAAAISTVVAYGTMAVYRHYDMRKHVCVTYEKRSVLIMVLLYILATMLYYVESVWANMMALVITLSVTYWLNRNELGQMKNLVTGRFGKSKLKATV